MTIENKAMAIVSRMNSNTATSKDAEEARELVLRIQKLNRRNLGEWTVELMQMCLGYDYSPTNYSHGRIANYDARVMARDPENVKRILNKIYHQRDWRGVPKAVQNDLKSRGLIVWHFQARVYKLTAAGEQVIFA